MCQAEAAFPQAHILARKAGTLLFKAAQQLAGPKLRARLAAASSSETPEILFAFTCSQQLFCQPFQSPGTFPLLTQHLTMALLPSSSRHCLAAPQY